MAVIQCKMCGGAVELPQGMTSGECPYCGSLTTFPKVNDEHREQLYNRAEHFRLASDFDKAVSAYEALINEDSSDPEAYWGLVLSRFGIEYVEDPATHERIPTCHRVQFESILADPDYKMALENSSGTDRDIYEKEAQRIAEIQKGILAISSQEKPFDVFICCKETTDGGTRTKDSVVAQEIYYQLVNAGYKVFFARITLEDKLGQQYEPYIFAALNSAKVMLVIGSKKEFFEAVWVRNEWSRFLALMKKARSKMLIPCYRDMDVYDLPQELSLLQSQDMGKIGFIQDLLRGIRKVVNPEGAGAKAKAGEGAAAGSQAAPLLKRIAIFLSTKDWQSAAEYCEKVLDLDPEQAHVYVYKLLAKNQLSAEDELYKVENLGSCTDFQLAMRFADAAGKQRLNAALEKQARVREEEARRRRIGSFRTATENMDFRTVPPGDIRALLADSKGDPDLSAIRDRFIRRVYDTAVSLENEDSRRAIVLLGCIAPELPEAVELTHAIGLRMLEELKNGSGTSSDFYELRKFYRLQAPFLSTLADESQRIGVELRMQEYRQECAAAYREAISLMKKMRFRKAQLAFALIADYADAAEKAVLCRKIAQWKYVAFLVMLGIIALFNLNWIGACFGSTVCMRHLAVQGKAWGQYKLGVCFQNGHGVAKDAAEAAKWFRKAAEQGHADAQCSLGICYLSGNGVELDAAEALKWFRKAADQGNSRAQINLGLCYEHGQGVGKNFFEAEKWYRKAGDRGRLEEVLKKR